MHCAMCTFQCALCKTGCSATTHSLRLHMQNSSAALHLRLACNERAYSNEPDHSPVCLSVCLCAMVIIPRVQIEISTRTGEPQTVARPRRLLRASGLQLGGSQVATGTC